MFSVGSSDIDATHQGTADLTLGAYDIKRIKIGRRRGRKKTVEVVRNAFKGRMAQLVLCDGVLSDLK